MRKRQREKNNKTVKNESWELTQIFRELSKCQREMGRESTNFESKIDQNMGQRRTDT